MPNKKNTDNWMINKAWARDGKVVIHGEALLLAMLMHTTGADRNSKDMADVRRIMKDHNRSQ